MSGFEPIRYHHGEVALAGRLIRPAGPARAGIVIYPTIINGSARIEQAARDLAASGYLAFIADFYGEIPADFDAARPLADAVRADTGYFRQRLRAALDALRGLPEMQGLPMAAIGYCMGGAAVLELARDRADLAAVVSFHGLLDTDRPATPGAIAARILVCHGDADPLAPRENVLAFWREMDAAGAIWHFHSYSGVKHNFTDPASDLRGSDMFGYNASADRQSWAAMQSLFDEVFAAG